MSVPQAAGLQSRCELLRSLHRPGEPLLLPNAWDAATAKAVVAAGFPVVATTSWGVAESLGYEDDERAPAEEMLAAAARIARSVDVPVTVDAEAGYGMEPRDLVGALRSAGAAGCNLEETNHPDEALRDPERQADWLRAVRQAASEDGYPLVINARVDVFLWPYIADPSPGVQAPLVDEALRRANAYLDAGADCVYPITVSDEEDVAALVDALGVVNVNLGPRSPSVARFAELGVARISVGSGLHRIMTKQVGAVLGALRDGDDSAFREG
jgi:2-methylisocitrate lyase-like PEP mutase family enzyme